MSKKVYILTPIIMLAVGIALIILHQRADVLSWVVILLGVMFIVPSLFNIIWTWIHYRRMKANAGGAYIDGSMVVNLGALALGIVMVAIPDVLVGFIVYLFAAVLALYGIYTIVVMSRLARPGALFWPFYIVPVLMIAAGIVLAFTPVKTISSIVVLITGIALALSGLNCLVQAASRPAPPSRQITQ